MSDYFTGVDESLWRTSLWFALIVAVSYAVLVASHASLRLLLRWVSRPTIASAKARKRTVR